MINKTCIMCNNYDTPKNHIVYSTSDKKYYCVRHLPKGNAWSDNFDNTNKVVEKDIIRDWRDNL